ncbi:CPBP family intramembrane metalloprotease [Lederbergia sp. NSJ-179]|uniref:CPBP family intramembrane glutamic endopeptidase n=1 Tax=Lederbergia sp. NSJ-179 TaxID=2931402 RepID=UPI001FD02D9B|nr:CPBP family intramembrane glutamic endopeptidase [Lederbergia sp. NSJ-179]MCJ7841359.1 CPBP family intramembrane metalloprotease [Lederbergia sp. NSJ-179]
MNKKYLYIVITFLAMHLSAFIGVPLLLFLGVLVFDIPQNTMVIWSTSIWTVLSFILGLIVVLLILRKAEPYTKVEKQTPLPLNLSILWAIGGIFIALVAQMAAAGIEYLIGIEPGSENTKQIIDLIEKMPIVILASSIIGPILEEIVFRKVIFGVLYNRFSFWVSALLSSLAFSIAHMEPTHLILYAAMGFTFSFLYVKTKRIIVPILSHMMMNTFVTINAFFLDPEDLNKVPEQVQGLIGGIF